jgi:outer membrane lipoprotein-sorting protein
MSETDLIVNGDQAWLWESEANKATRIKVDAQAVQARAGEAQRAQQAQKALPTATTPQQLAQELLKETGADTVVSVTNTEKVADRAAYQLVLAPKDGSSLVKEVRLALDGETFVPLRVQVYAKSAAEPAFEVGFTSVTFTPPSTDNFTFTPPAGAKVGEENSLDTLASEQGKAGQERAEGLKDKVKTVGDGWTTVVVLPFQALDLKVKMPKEQGDGPTGQDTNAIVDALLKSAKPVSGTWGSGKVIQTKLVSALLTDDGRLLVGAVTPEKLTEAAGQK